LLEKFWSLDAISVENCAGETSPYTYDELKALEIVEKTSYYVEEKNRWFVGLPLKTSNIDLGDNFQSSVAVMKSVERAIAKRDSKKGVNQAYQDLIDNGFARKLSESELHKNTNQLCHYIPSFAVYAPGKETSKVRIVYNGSAKTQTGKSLNSILYPGPSFTKDITIMLTKFRSGKFTLIFDCKAMFLNIHLANPDHARLLRYVWRGADPTIPPQEHEFHTILFGLTCSPFLSAWCVQKTAELFAEKYPLGSKIAKNEIYVDDIVVSLNNKQECRTAVQELQDLFGKASLKLHKFNTNLPELRSLLKPDQLSEKIETKVLGQTWNSDTDYIYFTFTEKEISAKSKKCTKRSFLSEMSSLFDPLQLLCPLLLHIKLCFQSLWQTSVLWDSDLPDDIASKWQQFKSQLHLLKDFKLPRALFESKPVKHHSLLTFCDSSELGYGSVSYLFTKYSDGSVTVRFIMAKSRIKPLKPVGSDSQMTIVRLELLGMLTGVRLAVHLKSALLDKLTLKQCIFFTDSSINYFRIRKGFSNLKQWSGNRIRECLAHTSPSDWIHIPTDYNIADYLSRGEKDVELFLKRTDWLNGPQFLYCDKPWDSYSKVNSMKAPPPNQADGELKSTVAFAKTKIVTQELFAQFNGKFSDWFKTLRVFAYILRFGCKIQRNFLRKPLMHDEIRLAEIRVIYLIQKSCFTSEYEALLHGSSNVASDSPIAKHNPFLDGLVIRANTRLAYSETLSYDEKFPILLPRHCKLVESLILGLHTSNHHLGLMHMLAKLRSRFIILGGRREITRVLNTCPHRHCRHIVPASQLMSPLPASRIDGSEPFKYVALDYAGPLLISGLSKESNAPQKVWIAVFSDFLTRAVHYELVLSLTTEEVINAVRLLIARRGMPQTLYSDNQSSFRAADKELKSLLAQIKWCYISQFATNKGFNWEFCLPNSPHLNGLCERAVKMMKQALRKTFTKTTLSFRQLSILLSECESLSNSRPLRPASDCLPTPITPFHLLYGRPFDSLPVQSSSRNLSLSDLWLKRKHILHAFFKTFSHDYLLSLAVRKKWSAINDTNLLGRHVLLNDSNTPSYTWKTGVVTACFPSKDGLIRQVEVKLPNGSVRRSVQTLSLFEEDFSSSPVDHSSLNHNVGAS